MCTDVLTDVTTLKEIINLNCIPSVQVHDTVVTRPLRLALGSTTPDYTASQDCNTLIQDTKNLIAGASAILRVQWNGRSESAISICYCC